ncbi:hypothetical protein QWY14_01715 [Planococcus sp. N028]|uniref:Competence protein ComG n=1 Tax=Planococcus shixiaomingii TaxID=3058393 RepID=A0ABT8MY11_9BACL|nr:hypothetical protein [Planococcus sp. N028]MDN7240483.1 hypothetical protein [Planococcus sp. N028]
MLSLMMVFVLFGTLLPVLHGVHEKLQLKKERVTAYETLHEGALQMQSEKSTYGTRTVNGVAYQWQMDEYLCVRYNNYKGTPTAICLK